MTTALMSVRHSVAHRPKIGEKAVAYGLQKENRRSGGPLDSTIPLRPEETTVRICCFFPE